MRLKKTGIAAMLFATSLLVPARGADMTVYRWKDASGQIHYGQTPPPSGDYDVMQGARIAPVTPPTETSNAAAEAQRSRDQRFLEEAEAARKAKADARAKEKAAKAEKAQRCEAARETAHAIEQHHGYIGMNEDEYTRRMEEVRKDIATHCG